MGIIEGLALWVAVSVLFCISIGKLLHSVDAREQRRAANQSSNPGSLVGLNPSAAGHR